MEKCFKRLSCYATILFSTAALNLRKVSATGGSVNIDTQGAKNLLKELLNPIIDIALWIIPLVYAAMCLIEGVKYLTKDEREREQQPYVKTWVKLTKYALMIYLIPTIAKIVGLAMPE